MEMTELEMMARQTLAETWDSYGRPDGPSGDVIIKAIMTALTKSPPGWKLVPEKIEKGSSFEAYVDDAFEYQSTPQNNWDTLLAAAPEYKEDAP